MTDAVHTARRDLDTRGEIHDLVVRFYREIVFDDLLAPVFEEVAETAKTHAARTAVMLARQLLGTEWHPQRKDEHTTRPVTPTSTLADLVIEALARAAVFEHARPPPRCIERSRS